MFGNNQSENLSIKFMNVNQITYFDFHLEVILSTQAHFKLLSGVMTGKFTFVPLGAAEKLRFPLTPSI